MNEESRSIGTVPRSPDPATTPPGCGRLPSGVRTMDLDTVETGVAAGGTGQVLTVELFFDRYEEGKSVREITDKLETLALVNAELHRAPTALLTWGTGLAFRCMVEKAVVANTAFLSDGTPVGAVALVRLAILESCAL